MNTLYGPNGAMCCECAKWQKCLVHFTPEWSTMKVIQTFKNDPFLDGGTFKMVKCEDYVKEESMTEYSLPYDYTRCNGATENGEIHLTCVSCLRRLAPPHPVRQAYFTDMSPDKEGKCVMFINSEKRKGE